MAADHEDPRAPAAPTGTDAALAAEAEAWAAVRAAWADEAAHRAYLARVPDLEGLARAGGRYRAVLAEEPGDAVAARWRDEVVRRAMVQGLASLPRTRPPRRLPRWAAIALFGGGGGLLLAWAGTALFRLLGHSQGAPP